MADLSGAPVIVGVIPGQDPSVWAWALELAYSAAHRGLRGPSQLPDRMDARG